MKTLLRNKITLCILLDSSVVVTFNHVTMYEECNMSCHVTKFTSKAHGGLAFLTAPRKKVLNFTKKVKFNTFFGEAACKLPPVEMVYPVVSAAYAEV